MPLRASLGRSTRILAILAVPLVGLWFRNDVGARSLESVGALGREAAELGRGFRNTAAQVVRREPWCPGALESGEFGRLEIPRLGVSTLIAEGAEPVQLLRAVGHVAATAFPGQPGNCALAGLGDGHLRGLEGVRPNDIIRIDTLQGTYTYEVEWATTIGPDGVDVLDETAAPCLTVVTCHPRHAVCRAPESFVVRARLVPAAAVAASNE